MRVKRLQDLACRVRTTTDQVSFKASVVKHFVLTRYFVPNKSRTRIEKFQLKKLAIHVASLVKTSAYVRDVASSNRHFKTHVVGDSREARATREVLSSLPVMDKSVMMGLFNDINTGGLDRDEALEVAIQSERDRDFDSSYRGFAVGLSSGTSGHRGLFVVSKRERAQWAGTILALTLPRRRIFGHRIALFLRAGNQLYDSVGSRAVSFKYFDVYRPLEVNVKALCDFAPTLLVAPPSVLREIARVKSEMGLELEFQKVYSVAEVLEPLDEKYLKDAFNQSRIHQIYQCTEGLLGSTCEQGTIHLNESAAIFEREYVSEGRFIPIVTDFERKTQPILRYRLNDILRERDQPCPCGSKKIALGAIEGREDDSLLLPDSKGQQTVVFADLVSRALTYAHGVVEFRVLQTGTSHLEIFLASSDESSLELTQRSVSNELHALFGKLDLGEVTLEFHPYERDPRAKLRRIERAVAR